MPGFPSEGERAETCGIVWWPPPWTTSCKHLGNTIVSTAKAEDHDIRSQDIKGKILLYSPQNYLTHKYDQKLAFLWVCAVENGVKVCG